jgi:hypothetical protein
MELFMSDFKELDKFLKQNKPEAPNAHHTEWETILNRVQKENEDKTFFNFSLKEVLMKFLLPIAFASLAVIVLQMNKMPSSAKMTSLSPQQFSELVQLEDESLGHIGEDWLGNSQYF